jgi:hypothetical protein
MIPPWLPVIAIVLATRRGSFTAVTTVFVARAVVTIVAGRGTTVVVGVSTRFLSGQQT